jgi:hypothetical protein
MFLREVLGVTCLVPREIVRLHSAVGGEEFGLGGDGKESMCGFNFEHRSHLKFWRQ